jgi:COP9 signalosome complex subunit 6
MAGSAPNPLLAVSSSTTSPEIQLHPLVILTVSDLITRRTLRNQNGPLVGAILGSQNGRVITAEVAFDCKVHVEADGTVLLDQAFFDVRLQQRTLIHRQCKV